MITIHPTAVVETGTTLGRHVHIGAFSFIEAGAELGDGCQIGSHVTIFRYTSVGPGCRVHAGAVLGDLPQDRGFDGSDSYVKIGADCVLREGVTVHRGSKSGTCTEIGEGCMLMAYAHCAHNVKLGHSVIVANGALLGGYVEVGAQAFVSGNVIIHQFTRVGRLAMVGGGSGLSKDVPPFCTVRPVALNRVAGLNVVGMRRAGLAAEERAAIKRAFTILYRSGLNTTQARLQIQARFQEGPALEFCDFIDTSQRGICAFASEHRRLR